MQEKTLFADIYALVRRIPEGKAATYGLIAALTGNPRRSRVVGFALHVCPYPDVPCHRVVSRFGGLSDAFTPDGKETHRALLEAEGIPFTLDGRVDLALCLWDGE